MHLRYTFLSLALGVKPATLHIVALVGIQELNLRVEEKLKLACVWGFSTLYTSVQFELDDAFEETRLHTV